MTTPRRGRSRGSPAVQWYTPSELVVVVELAQRQPRPSLHQDIQQALEQAVAGTTGGLLRADQSRPEPIVFGGTADRPGLAFLLFDLDGDADHTRVRDAVQAVHRTDLGGLLPARRGRPVGVMPHWLSMAQQDCVGGSPGSLPRPVRRDELPKGDRAWRYVYRARASALDLQAAAAELPSAPLVRVAVLDSAPDQQQVTRATKRLGALNAQLAAVAAMVEAAPASASAPPAQAHQPQLQRVGRHGLGPAYDLSDHGLFVASLIHGVAPRAPIQLLPVLGSNGVGDLATLLRALARLLAAKDPAEPLIVNLSLGLLPPLERLPFVWYGATLRDDPGHVPDVVQTAGQPASGAWLRSHSLEVQRGSSLLHAGLEHLADLLLAHNCLLIAAAGNDSLQRVEAGRRRLGPRVPACYRSVLGVAASAKGDSQGAAYSNMGDEWGYGDHVATFGGDVDEHDEPTDGVIGVYTATQFPDPATGRGSRALGANETGWARWSGTSFATALVSGLAANLWAVRRAEGGEPPAAAAILGQLATHAAAFTPDLGTPAIPLEGAWQPA